MPCPLQRLLFLRVAGHRNRLSRRRHAGPFRRNEITPKRNLFFQSYGDDYEFGFYFDGPLPEFRASLVQCQILGSSQSEQASPVSVVVQVLRSEFKLA